MDFILQIFWINFILFVWFETDGFIEYCKLFRIQKLFKIDKFEIYKKESNPNINYLSYLRQKHTSFFSKLVTCVPCLNFWMVLVISSLWGSSHLYPILYLVSYATYKILKKIIYG